MRAIATTVFDRIVDLPASATLDVGREGFGHIADLADDELADPNELERVLTFELWAPLFALPFGHVPAHVEFGSCLNPDWESIGMIDCQAEREWKKSPQLRARFDSVTGNATKGQSEVRA